MPKTVDHTAQRRAIASAAMTRIGEAGLEGARLRDVALAAHVTTGAVTHYFDGKDALLEAALAEVARRILERQRDGDRRSLIDQVMAYMPVDAESRNEWRVWLAFWGRAIHEPRLAATHRAYYREIMGRLAEGLRQALSLPDDDARRAADAIVAAIDGVGTRATLEPNDWPPERQRETLALMLAGLTPK